MAKTITRKTTLPRPPIVAVLGHVDHGKTSLLDVIRKSDVAKHEFGGITQHIGAYQVEIKTKEGKRKITFIDTPGHEAFSKMRSQGATVTDLVILVIDACEGVKPQTEESINHIKKANVPFIVAATKMDLPQASLERVKKHLAKIGILTEGYGGDVVVVPVSAVSKTGINELLEMILLVLEMRGLEGNEKDPFSGVIIESKLDNKRGPLATVLVKRGIIRKGDDIFLGQEKVRIRAMFDEYGVNLNEAFPSKPVEILGFESVPPVGAIVTKDKTLIRQPLIERTITPIEEDQKLLKIILKTDTVGSLEAILGQLRNNNNIVVLQTGLGNIGESEILRAKVSGALVIGFNVKIAKAVKKLAENEKVLVKTYTIIYELLEELYDVSEMIAQKEKEEIIGRGKIIATFLTSAGKIAGIKVIAGRLAKGDRVKLQRAEKEIGVGRILNLKQGKEDISKVREGEECGAKLSANLDFQISDVISSVKLTEMTLA